MLRDTEEPWYRNFLVWLVIAIPALTVLGCAFTIFLAISNPDSLVTETDPGKYLQAEEPRKRSD